MDAINFVNYIKNPGYLNQVTFQELNNLIEQYPFCQNLHYLALRKAQIENHKDFVKKLGLAATYCPDRQWLYKQLQEVQTPDAISDIVEEEAQDEDVDIAEANTAAPLAFEDIPVPIEIENTAQDFVNDEVEEIIIDEILEISENPDIEKIPVLSNQEVVDSHSISDNDQDEEEATDPIDDIDLNLQNPEDMTPPDDKDKKVVYIEDLFEDADILKESKSTSEPTDEEKTILFESENTVEDDLEEGSNSSVTDLDFNPSKDHIKSIPFEVYQPGEEEEKVEEKDDQTTESDLFPETEHINDDLIEQPERITPKLNPSIEVPVDALNEDEEEIDFTEEEESISEKQEEESEGQKAENQSPEVAPMPKSAFNSWHQVNAYVLKTTVKKTKEKKGEKVPVYKVADLFKEKGTKEKSTKNKKKKKKGTKGFAMESLLEHKDVISETLAKLLAGQGRRKKAIGMYRRLIEMHPEKKDSYEKRIKKLKKKG